MRECLADARHKHEYSSRRLHGHEGKNEVREDGKRKRSLTPLEPHPRLDFGLKDVKVLVQAPRGHALQIAIDAIQIGKDRQDRAKSDHTEVESK